MSDGATIVGRGGIVLNTASNQGTVQTITLRYEVYHDKIQFYQLGTGDSPFDIFATLGDRDFTVIRGHLTLVSLPASPQAAFHRVTLSCRSGQVSLGVSQASSFAARGSTFFKDLNLQFTQQQSATTLDVTGQVTLVLLDLDLLLQPELTRDRGLLFQYKLPQSASALAIEPLGNLDIKKLEVGSNSNPWTELRTLYTFDEGTSNTFFDSSGSFDSSQRRQSPLDLELSATSAKVQAVTGGIAASISTNLRSKEKATKIIEACRRNKAITIEAWVKPGAAVQPPADIRGPARIVTLSRDTDNRFFTLGQGHNDGRPGDLYTARLRTTQTNANGSLNNNNPALATPPGSVKTELSYVVFTHDANGAEALYIDTVEKARGILAGDLFDIRSDERNNPNKNPDETFRLVLANELTGGDTSRKNEDRSWAGEFHRVAIYSRALTKDDILRSYYPNIQIEADLTLSKVPAPLNVPLPVTISIADNQLSVQKTGLAIAPHFEFTQINLAWRKTPTTLELFSGEVTARLWGNDLKFAASLTSDRLSLQHTPLAGTTRTNLLLNNLGAINLSLFEMSANRVDNPNWEFRTDGQVTFSAIPSPLKGPLLVRFLLEDERFWFNINPNPPSLQIVEQLAFDRADLKFAYGPNEWDVQGNIGILLFGRSLPLVPSFVPEGAVRIFSLDHTVASPPPPETLTNGLGKLDITRFNLRAVPSGGNATWQLLLLGRVPLRQGDKEQLAAVLDLNASGTIAGRPVQLTGKSELRSLSTPIFGGDLQIRGDRFLLNGKLVPFPDWSLLQVSSATLIEIDPTGFLRFTSAAQVALPDFVLLDSQVLMDNGRLSLQGRWLGEPISFTAIQQDDQFVWVGEVLFRLPFSLTPGPIYEPRTNLKLTDRMSLSQESNSRRMMNAILGIELSASGFLASASCSFRWKDNLLMDHDVTMPEFSLFTPPATRNALLSQIIEELRANADELFAKDFKAQTGYFFTTSASPDRHKQGVIRYGDRLLPHNQPVRTILPKLSATTVNLEAQGVFQLEQSTEQCVLTLQTNGTPEQIFSAYTNLLKELTRQEQAGTLLPGAIPLVKQRIAERLPMPLSQVLYYFYGFNSEDGYLDLQPGMRLRVDYQQYQELPITDRTTEKGFAGSGTSYFQVNTYLFSGSTASTQEYLLGFDPFVMQTRSRVDTITPTQGAGGILDLQQSAYRQPYFRLFYPSTFSDVRGRIGPDRAVTIVGAKDLTEMAAATDDYLARNRAITTTNNTRNSFFFRGRVTVIPEIAVFIREQPVYVSIGTTLRQIVEYYGDIPTNRFIGPYLQPLQAELRPRRLVHEGVANEPSYNFINIDKYQRYDNGTDILDLPVVKGDRFYF